MPILDRPERRRRLVDRIRGNLRYPAGLRGFLRETLSEGQATALVREQLERRGESFLRILELGVYARPLGSIVASPRLGSVDEATLVATVLDFLGSSPAGELMASQWRQGRTLRVSRRDPYVTRAAKILPLHVRRDGR